MSYLRDNRHFKGSRELQQKELDKEDRTTEWYEQSCRGLLKNSLRTVGDTNQVAQNTAEQLHLQSEQLQRIERDVDRISENLDTSQYLIKGMKSWWGSVVQLFTSPPLPTQEKTLMSPPPIVPSENYLEFPANKTKLVNSTVHIAPNATTSAQSEIEEDLGQLSEMLGELHLKAVEMGNTLSQHNNILDSVQGTLQNNSARMTKQKADIQRLLKR